MLQKITRTGCSCLVAVGLVAIVCCAHARAEERTGKIALAAVAPDDPDEAAKDNEEEAKPDPYKVPDGNVKELLAFIAKVKAIRPTPQEYGQHRVKSQAAIKAAAEKIRDMATDDDKKLEGYDDAMATLLIYRASDSRRATDEALQKLADDIKEFLSGARAESALALASSAAMQLATGLEYGGKTDKAVDLYRDLGGVLSQSKTLQVMTTGQKMLGAARRLTLPGNLLEISGTKMDGSKFDWNEYRGKVVLVDFWATWCGPCLAEVPNVKKNYELYHDRGFDVVAISLDRDRARLEAFLDKEKNPWITLHDGDWSDNSVATYYGIMGIPTVILVDKEGKVLSTQARGPELGKLLEKELGPAEPAAEPAADAAPK